MSQPIWIHRIAYWLEKLMWQCVLPSLICGTLIVYQQSLSPTATNLYLTTYIQLHITKLILLYII